MNNKYWINDWAKFRQDEIVRVPKDYKIHQDFTLYTGKKEIKSCFSQINSLYADIYGDIAKYPDEFGMPLREKEKYRWFSQEWRDSGQAPYRPFILLYNLFICGDIKENTVNVSIQKYKSIKLPPKGLSGFDQKLSQTHFLFKKLCDYGFVFEGLKNNKAMDDDIIISYPDNTILLYLFKMLADKAHNTNRLGDFLCCSFRLLQDDINTVNYGDMEDMLDNVYTETEKEFILNMDKTLMSIGLFRKYFRGYEGPGLAYYHSEKIMESKGPYTYGIKSRSEDIFDFRPEKMLLELRIRNVSRCLDYLKNCPVSVKRIFTDKNDNGCGKRIDNSCKHSVTYEMGKKKYWRCGCCHTAFSFKPNIEDIPHYIKLIELGEKK